MITDKMRKVMLAKWGTMPSVFTSWRSEPVFKPDREFIKKATEEYLASGGTIEIQDSQPDGETSLAELEVTEFYY